MLTTLLLKRVDMGQLAVVARTGFDEEREGNEWVNRIELMLLNVILFYLKQVPCASCCNINRIVEPVV
jgi:hypothetical protein